MARDKGLEELIRNQLSGQRGLTEKAMFGGWAWLLNGKLLCAARHDGALVRVGAGNDLEELKSPGVTRMISRGREMRGWIRIEAETFCDGQFAVTAIQKAIAFVRSLPAKE